MTKAKAKAKPAIGYKDHSPGSRKGKIHELFDKEGQETACVRGLKMGLKQTTLRTCNANGAPGPISRGRGYQSIHNGVERSQPVGHGASEAYQACHEDTPKRRLNKPLS